VSVVDTPDSDISQSGIPASDTASDGALTRDELHRQQRQLRAGGAALLSRDVIRVVGSDAESFLQGQLSADITVLANEEAAWSLLLGPSGKMGFWLRVSRLEAETFLIDVDRGFADAVVARLERFKLRTKAEISVEDPDEWVAMAVRGPVQVELDHSAGSTVLTLPAPWPGLIGWDVLAPASAHVRLDTPIVGSEALEAVRLECGVASMGAEITDEVIPGEIGQWLIDSSVSFTKGCYTGQELVARIDSRGGNVPRRLRAVVTDTLCAVGDEVVVGDKVVGVITSVADSAVVGPMGLALVARSVEPSTVVGVRGAAGVVAAEVRELPVVDDLSGSDEPADVPVTLGS
jgi:folate-binding protein YgfZ